MVEEKFQVKEASTLAIILVQAGEAEALEDVLMLKEMVSPAFTGQVLVNVLSVLTSDVIKKMYTLAWVTLVKTNSKSVS
jgi:hypothetical protein